MGPPAPPGSRRQGPSALRRQPCPNPARPQPLRPSLRCFLQRPLPGACVAGSPNGRPGRASREQHPRHPPAPPSWWKGGQLRRNPPRSGTARRGPSPRAGSPSGPREARAALTAATGGAYSPRASHKPRERRLLKPPPSERPGRSRLS